jgi:hypothetical protein
MSSLQSGGVIFISYRRDDTAPYAGRLYDRVSDRFGEERVFMDVDSIAIGLDFARVINEAVSASSVLLVLIGRNWLAATDSQGRRRIDNLDDFVRVEIETALKRDIRVVPVLVEGAGLPKATDLPPSLRSLAGRQAIELSHSGFGAEVTRLIAAVSQALEESMGPQWTAELTASTRNSRILSITLNRTHLLEVKVWRRQPDFLFDHNTVSVINIDTENRRTFAKGRNFFKIVEDIRQYEAELYLDYNWTNTITAFSLFVDARRIYTER